MTGGGIKSRRGRCTACKLVFVWDGPPLLRDARCPRCGMDLRTSLTMSAGQKLMERPTDARFMQILR